MPDLTSNAGKVIVIFIKGAYQAPGIALRDWSLVRLGGCVFATGISLSSLPSGLDFFAGLRRSIAWDAVESYLTFDSVQEYTDRVRQSMPPPPGGGNSSWINETPGAPVEPSGVPVDDDTELEVGMRVIAKWSGSWWRAEIVKVESRRRVRVHFLGWDDTWDQSVARSDLQIDFSDSIEPN